MLKDDLCYVGYLCSGNLMHRFKSYPRSDFLWFSKANQSEVPLVRTLCAAPPSELSRNFLPIVVIVLPPQGLELLLSTARLSVAVYEYLRGHSQRVTDPTDRGH